jgi:hypothetical protein
MVSAYKDLKKARNEYVKLKMLLLILLIKLHDGRARTFEEAILWHRGEAQSSREAFRNMSSKDRQALVWFLRSL